MDFSLLGDVTLSAEDKPPLFNMMRTASSEAPSIVPQALPVDHLSVESHEEHFDEYDDDEEEEHHSWLEGHAALKFLAAGGIAGAGECRWFIIT